MTDYILISYLNDFIFCPKSIYFHKLYGLKSQYLYHDTFQAEGKAVHETVDNKNYSTRKNILQGIDVYSNKYNLCGKIDLFDIDKGLLMERKKHISTIYDGYIFQLYAQYYSLIEMEYKVKKIQLYSFDTNKVYPVKLPDEDIEMKNKFENLIEQINNFDINSKIDTNINKCKRCIYNTLCDQSLC